MKLPLKLIPHPSLGVEMVDSEGVSVLTDIENATQIINAVNCHKDLVNALKDVMSIVPDGCHAKHHGVSGAEGIRIVSLHKKYLDRARQIIANAK